MKKILIFVLTFLILIATVGCSNVQAPSVEDIPPENGTDVQVSDDSKENVLEGNIYLLENIYEGDNDKEIKDFIKKNQGKFKHLLGNSTVSLIATKDSVNNYYPNFSNIISTNGGYDWIRFFNNMEYGKMFVLYKDGKITAMQPNNEIRFKDIPFNDNTDFIDTISSSYLTIITSENNSYSVVYYEKENENWVLKSTKPITSAEPEYGTENITIKSIMSVEDDSYGFKNYVIDDKNNAWEIDHVSSNGKVITKKKTHQMDNVARIYPQFTLDSVAITPFVKNDNNKLSLRLYNALEKVDTTIDIDFPEKYNADNILKFIEIKSESYALMPDRFIIIMNDGTCFMTDVAVTNTTTDIGFVKLEELSRFIINNMAFEVEIFNGALIKQHLVLIDKDGKVYAAEIAELEEK